MQKACSIWIGFDPRESQAFSVCRSSIGHYQAAPQYPVRGIVLSNLQYRGLYTRPVERRVMQVLCHCGCGKVINETTQLWDPISEAPMSTEFAISRFFTPLLVREGKCAHEFKQWALFMDCDIMARSSISPLFDLAKDKYAVMVVKHDHNPDYSLKMDGQLQVKYHRKNWSSVMLFNCNHPAHEALTLEMLNTLPGRDLHRFCWLDDDLIGELPPVWNYLVGHTKIEEKPRLVHFTDGIPSMPGYENCEYSEEYRCALERWAR